MSWYDDPDLYPLDEEEDGAAPGEYPELPERPEDPEAFEELDER